MMCGVEQSMEWLEGRREKLALAIRTAEADRDRQRTQALRHEYLKIIERIDALRESIQRGGS